MKESNFDDRLLSYLCEKVIKEEKESFEVINSQCYKTVIDVFVNVYRLSNSIKYLNKAKVIENLKAQRKAQLMRLNIEDDSKIDDLIKDESTSRVNMNAESCPGLQALIKMAYSTEKVGNVYEHADKLIRLCSNVSSAVFYLNLYIKIKHYGDANAPVHDACLFSLPSYGEWNNKLWYMIVKKNIKDKHNKKKIFGLLAQAPVIQEKLGRKLIQEKLGRKLSPKTPIRDLADCIISYTNASKNYEAALLFTWNEIDETLFDYYLTLKPCDDDKLIPPPSKVIEQDGYTIVKLSSFAPEAAFLGKYASCCQSLGVENGAGHDCTIYGITQPDSGFYVVKDRRGRIVAKTWAWRTGNTIVFGSIQSSTAVFGDVRAHGGKHIVLFKRLAKDLIENHNIACVNVGAGGHTPTTLGIPIPKGISLPSLKADKDFGYNDARSQRALAYSVAHMRETLGVSLPDDPKDWEISDLRAQIDNKLKLIWVLYYLQDVQDAEQIIEGLLPIILRLLNNGDDFAFILEYLNEAQRTIVFEAVKDELPSIIETSFDFYSVLKYLNIAQCTVVCKALKDSLPTIIEDIDHLILVLEFLNETQRTPFLEAMKGKLLPFLKNSDDFRRIEEYLDKEQCAEIQTALSIPMKLKNAYTQLSFFSSKYQDTFSEAIYSSPVELVP